jgi:hypothetical protein
MESFKQFVEQQESVEQILNEFNGVPSAQAAPQIAAIPPAQKIKPWSAKKPEIMQMWQNMRADTPIIMTPLADATPSNHHSTYGEDGFRVTGSWQFISSVMARLKEIIQYENPQHKLRLVLRGVDKNRGTRPDRQSFVFYCNLEGREHGKAGRPKTLVTQMPTI